jgi:hypothetical protein
MCFDRGAAATIAIFAGCHGGQKWRRRLAVKTRILWIAERHKAGLRKQGRDRPGMLRRRLEGFIQPGRTTVQASIIDRQIN